MQKVVYCYHYYPENDCAAADLNFVSEDTLSVFKRFAKGLLAVDPYQQPPPFEALVGDLRGAYSRRINIQHRLVYQVLEEPRIVKLLRLWTHYD